MKEAAYMAVLVIAAVLAGALGPRLSGLPARTVQEAVLMAMLLPLAGLIVRSGLRGDAAEPPLPKPPGPPAAV